MDRSDGAWSTRCVETGVNSQPEGCRDGLRAALLLGRFQQRLRGEFASSFGFRPTAQRREVRVADGRPEKDADEVAMVLPVSSDSSQTTDPYLS